MTSVEDAQCAAAITDALNRVSAYATVPVSVTDDRDDGYANYPHDHLGALTDPSRSAELLAGDHSLWYGLAMTGLHKALRDLQQVLNDVPPPVAIAVTAELQTEAEQIALVLDEHKHGFDPNRSITRQWIRNGPYVVSDGDLPDLTDHTRGELDDVEDGFEGDQLSQALVSLRLLWQITDRTVNDEAEWETSRMSIMYDEMMMGRDFFLLISAPVPGDHHRTSWKVSIDKWVPDSWDETGEADGHYNEGVLTCDLGPQPDIDQLVHLLDLCAKDENQLSAWATTPAGANLAGTSISVAVRDDA
ncbi:hypothetical protein ACFQY4_26110 [Catellatospora bangladeshensis]|uniref:hypothetical protein n=1 Tax=Catellatospora bangladeshensis TaxID=310355 RepID=UPI0036206252